MGSIDPGVDAVVSNPHLQTSVGRETAETPTLDAQTRCGQLGDLKSESEEVNKLTFEYRMPGERWRDDEDHG